MRKNLRGRETNVINGQERTTEEIGNFENRMIINKQN